MKKQKTILEWLEQAKNEGYEWADAAIKYMGEANTRNCQPNTRESSLSDAVDSVRWDETSEGFNFWESIWATLKNEGK